jgi:hypothetical protein
MKFSFPILAILLATSCQASPRAHRVIRVAVLDTGLDLNDPRFKDHLCKSGHRNFVTNQSIEDNHGHGTFIVGRIQKYAGNANYCMAIYKYYQDGAPDTVNDHREVEAIKAAIDGGANIVNISGGGPGFDEEEALLIKNSPNALFVVAAGNEGANIDISGHEYYPASLPYNNIVAVGGIDRYGQRMPESNYGKKISAKELGQNVESTLPNGQTGTLSGTSMSTAIHTGKIVDRLSKVWKY